MISVDNYIHYILLTHSEQVAQLWTIFSPIKSSHGVEADIRCVNEFLRREIGLLPFDTIDVRMSLIDCDYTTWCQDFDEFVAPFIVQYGLPCWQVEVAQ